MAYYLTDDEIAELWDRYSRGETSNALARRFGKSSASVSRRIQESGGIRPTIVARARRHLTLEDREEISRGLASGHSYRQIGRLLRRPASTISREVAVNPILCSCNPGGECRVLRYEVPDRVIELGLQLVNPGVRICKIAGKGRVRRREAVDLRAKILQAFFEVRGGVRSC